MKGVEERLVNSHGVYWVPLILTDSRGTTREVKRACLAVDRDPRLQGSPILLSCTALLYVRYPSPVEERVVVSRDFQ